MKVKYILLAFVAVALVSIAAKTTDKTSDASAQDKVKVVLDHHWETFKANDLEGVMADYTEESILITPDKTYKGLKEIRENFTNAFTVFPKGESTLTLTKSVIQSDIAYILWTAKTPKVNLTFATDTFIIKNGKIVRQTYAGVSSPQ